MNRDATTIALLVGTPILVGSVAYYYYYYHRGLHDDDSKYQTKSKQPESNASKVQALKEQGNRYFSRKRYDLAIQQYTEAIKIAIEFDTEINSTYLAIFYQNRAACHEATGNYQEVINDCGKAIEANKKYTKAYLRRAKAYKSIKEYEKALVDAHVVNFLEEFQNQTSLTLADSCAVELSKIKAAKAVKKIEGLLWPTNQETKNYFSSFICDPMYELSGLPIKTTSQLKDIYEKVSNIDLTDKPFEKLALATCLVMLNKIEDGAKLFEELLEDSSVSEKIKSNVMVKKINLLMADSRSIERFDSVVEKIKDLIAKAEVIDNSNPDICMAKAKVSMMVDNLDEALKSFNEAIRLKPDFHAAIAHKMYIECKTMLGRGQSVKEVLNSFKNGLEQYPQSVEIKGMYTQLFIEMNDFEQADREISEIIDLHPNDIDGYITRALLHMQLGDINKAESFLKKALAVDPVSRSVYDIFGSIRVQQGKMEEAIEIYKKGLKYSRTEDDFERFYTLLSSCEGHIAASKMLTFSTD